MRSLLKCVNVFCHFVFSILFQQCKCIYDLPKFYWNFPLGNWFSNFCHMTLLKIKICILAAIWNSRFFSLISLLDYGCLGCIQVRWKFCWEIPMAKYFSFPGSKWTPLAHKREREVACKLKCYKRVGMVNENEQ